ncbi:MAG TPA: DUF1800 family protein [Usitatibacter sp.]|nr:DUF1800 family protein [Usitatibacter sp.]
MGRITITLMAFAVLAARAAEPTGTAVEWYNAALGHYFFTSGPDEIANVDRGGAGPGWVRTGGEFGTFLRAGDAPGLSPVCRFYGTPGLGPNSHFYTPSATECELVKKDPGWTYEGVAFYIQEAQAGQCPAATTPVYRSYNQGAARNDSNHRYTVDATVFAKSSSFGYAREGVAMCAPLSSADLAADAVRLLRQATFGPTEAEAQRVASMGAAAWIDEQLALPATRYPAYAWMPANRPDACVDDRTQPIRADSFCSRDNYTLFQLQLQFFRDALAQPDQLRQRVAFALSQIMVVSGVDNARNYAMREYQQMLRDRAFGNFHDLLAAVTLSPVMGDYLDMANNNKTNAAAGTDPNENYAREILQLFSIGTTLLNADGTAQLDAAGKARATYELGEIKGFSRVFTGWTYPTVAGAVQRANGNNPRNYLGYMLAVDANHDFGVKPLLRATASPASLTMGQDLEFALSNIVSHPNAGPFIGKQLIQKLVTSDPSPAYVARVTAVFDNNGAGMRGDLRAVVRAILLDPEARGARKIDPGYGKLVEPVLFMTSLARAANARSDGVTFRASSNALGQFVFYAPSVFNYYPFDYVVPGSALPGPEFGVQTSTTAVARMNFANGLVFSNSIAPDTSVFGATGTTLDLAPYQSVGQDAAALAARLDKSLLAGRMSTPMRDAIIAAVNAYAATDTLNRARTALWLVVTSAQFQVQR